MEQRGLDCFLCEQSLHTHSRCAVCSVLIGVGHAEQRGYLIGTSMVCFDHGIVSHAALKQRQQADKRVRKEYEVLPELALDSDLLPRYVVGTEPPSVLTPKRAAELTGWNPHTVRVRIAKRKLPQVAWLVSPSGWKSGLYDRGELLAILAR